MSVHAQSWRSQPWMDDKFVSVHVTKRSADTIFVRISSPFSGEGTEKLLKCEHHTAEDARSHEPQNWDETQDSALICFMESFCVFLSFRRRKSCRSPRWCNSSIRCCHRDVTPSLDWRVLTREHDDEDCNIAADDYFSNFTTAVIFFCLLFLSMIWIHGFNSFSTFLHAWSWFSNKSFKFILSCLLREHSRTQHLEKLSGQYDRLALSQPFVCLSSDSWGFFFSFLFKNGSGRLGAFRMKLVDMSGIHISSSRSSQQKKI